MGTKTLIRIQLGFILIFGSLLAGCGTENKAHTVGPPTQTVGQFTEWPEGWQPTGGGARVVEMPDAAKGHVVLASPDTPGHRDYFRTLEQ